MKLVRRARPYLSDSGPGGVLSICVICPCGEWFVLCAAAIAGWVMLERTRGGSGDGGDVGEQVTGHGATAAQPVRRLGSCASASWMGKNLVLEAAAAPVADQPDEIGIWMERYSIDEDEYRTMTCTARNGGRTHLEVRTAQSARSARCGGHWNPARARRRACLRLCAVLKTYICVLLYQGY